jgi:CheY-like chemotaxis protein
MRTILVVDDDPVFVSEAENLLTGAGYRVLKAADGLCARRVMDQMHDSIDLAIVDLALPGINGFELIGVMSRRPSGIKIIATSGVYRETHLESATSIGAHAALRKPAGARRLPRELWLGTVRQLIGDPKAEPDPSAQPAILRGDSE